MHWLSQSQKVNHSVMKSFQLKIVHYFTRNDQIMALNGQDQRYLFDQEIAILI